jgi:integrase/recombinase XerD
LIEEHLQALRRGREYSKATAITAQVWLKRLKAFCGDRCPSQLRPADLALWQKELTWTPGPSGKLYSENTINQAVGAVRRLYRWAIAEGRIKTDPTGPLAMTKVAKRSRSNRLQLSTTETRKLLASPSLETPAGIRDRVIFAIILETGISRPACSRIDLGHFQPDTGALLTKGRSQQIHSLSPGLVADIERYLREARPLLLKGTHRALFLNSNGDRVSGASIQQSLRYHRQLCGL